MNIFEEVFIETMSAMAYLDLVESNDLTLSIESLSGYEINVVVPYMGDIIVFFSDDMKRTVGNNIFDCERSFSQDEFSDVIGEFLNVFAGKLLDKLHPDVLFEIGLPKKVSGDVVRVEQFLVTTFSDPTGGLVALYRPS